MEKENFVVMIDKRLVVVSAKDMREAHSKALSSHPSAKSVLILETVDTVLELLKPYSIISKHASV